MYMPQTLADILPGALALPDETKLLLAEQLLDSVSADTTPGADLLIEIERRHAEALANLSLMLPGEDVLSEIRKAVASHTGQL